MDKLEIPTRTERKLIEHSGMYRDVEIIDRPYRVLERQFSERRGCHEDVVEFLTDWEIIEAGGLDVFFKDGKRTVNWPWTGEDRRVKKKAKKKAKKKT